ncbi:MAG: DUF507 family protein [Nitrospirae bacterium]|nr:MAG: DUF507 family protein [Nitrospirota bacterium]
MRLNKPRIHQMATTILKRLQDHHRLEVTGSSESLLRGLEQTIIDELSVEDRLNAEVREMLKQFEKEFEQGRADYQKMFTLLKSKLVQERGLVL